MKHLSIDITEYLTMDEDEDPLLSLVTHTDLSSGCKQLLVDDSIFMIHDLGIPFLMKLYHWYTMTAGSRSLSRACDNHGYYPLVNMAIEIVSFPVKNSDFP